ncbi:hypothetical protein BJ322DRAFT_526599 [Thelephora terrestris]|uniref:F-box domain-containing protein n=1 Tax=Thelephora terrestris TaxID=56493 RepID=A0A9P6L9U8_9AGAM|nr:hypothetical protein BJ322DRAFT_526599 [Thelephora terrestris]
MAIRTSCQIPTMSTSNTDSPRLGGGSSVSYLLRAAKKELETLLLSRGIATTVDSEEISAVERDALELLRLSRCWKNRPAPISRLPPEVLALIPDFLEEKSREDIIIPLSHVCRSWREIFTSRSSLWTNFRCVDAEKTRVYLQRSKSSPISLWLKRNEGPISDDPFLQIPSHAISRLEYLDLLTTPEYLNKISDHLSLPTPCLQDLCITGVPDFAGAIPLLPPTIFNGDLSTLRLLHLRYIHTDLPWRNMLNLRSFSLRYGAWPGISVEKFLDFFESAPHLRCVELSFATPTFGGQPGRLVSLPHLKILHISGFQPSSLILEHLLVPVGAQITTSLPSSRIVDHLPRSYDNLRNLSNFTAISVEIRSPHVTIKLIGPNGQVCMNSLIDILHSPSYYLAQLDTSKIEGLEIFDSDPTSEDFYQALLPMKNLRTLTFSLCESIYSILALNPDPNSTNPIACPNLERLVIYTDDRADVKSVTKVAAARASKGVPFKTVGIIGREEIASAEAVADLRKYVLDVELGVEIDVAGDGGFWRVFSDRCKLTSELV